MHDYLASLTEKEEAPFTSENLTLVVRKARGSMRDALSLLDQAISYDGGQIPTAELAELLGVTDWRHLFALSDAVLSGDARGCLDRFEEVFRYAYDTRQFYVDLLEHFRNLVVCRAAAGAEGLVDATAEELAELTRLAAEHSIEHLQMLFRLLVGAEDEILRSASPKLVLEMNPAGDGDGRAGRVAGRADRQGRRAARTGGAYRPPRRPDRRPRDAGLCTGTRARA